MPDPHFQLHPQLANDTVPLGDLALSRVLLMDDAAYPWLLLVPRRAGASEILDLDPSERGLLMEEVSQAAEALRAETGCDKLNIAALGNMVAQLHVHVIARFRGDAAWPRPVWGQAPARRYDAAGREALAARLRRRIGFAG